jgi:ubiquitin C-terminal hydrolase
MADTAKLTTDIVPDEYFTHSPARLPPSFGLTNTGAICWFNSLMQMMGSMTPLTRVLLANESLFRKNRFAMAYIKWLKSWDTCKDVLPVLKAFLERLRDTRRELRLGYGQECAEEGYTLLLDMFNSERVNKLFSSVYEVTITCEGCGARASSVRDRAMWIMLHAPLTESSMEHFSKYLRCHVTHGETFKCERCGHVVDRHMRVERLCVMRECVVIVFNKYFAKESVWFPPALEFPSITGSTLKYQRVATVEHSGSTAGGHYWANALRTTPGGGTPAEYRLNDSSVSSGSTAPTAATFIVAYVMV